MSLPHCEVRVVESAAPELDMAAVDAVRRWTYAPATRNGEPVEVIVPLPVKFTPK